MPTKPMAKMGAKAARETFHSLVSAGRAKPSTWLSKPSRTTASAAMTRTSFWYPVQRPSSTSGPMSTVGGEAGPGRPASWRSVAMVVSPLILLDPLQHEAEQRRVLLGPVDVGLADVARDERAAEGGLDGGGRVEVDDRVDVGFRHAVEPRDQRPVDGARGLDALVPGPVLEDDVERQLAGAGVLAADDARDVDEPDAHGDCPPTVTVSTGKRAQGSATWSRWWTANR